MSRILQGPKPKFTVPERNLGRFFFNRSREYSQRICQIDGTSNRSETYASVHLRATRVAMKLQETIKSNDVITICSVNTLDSAIPIIAGQYVGAKVSNLDSSLSVNHIRALLTLTTPRVLFIEDSALALVEEALKDASFEHDIVVFGSSLKYPVFDDFVQATEGEEEFVPLDVDPDEVCFMFFSSGTTGAPKAICHSHRSYIEIIKQSCSGGWGDDALHFTTFYWMTAMMILVGTFHLGKYRVFCRSVSAPEICRIIESYKVKTMFMAPVLTYKLTEFKEVSRFDTSSLNIVSIGGGTIASRQLERLQDLFPSATTSLLFGMTEIGIVSMFDCADQELAKRKSSSSGKPGPNMQIKVVDPSGNLLGAFEQGEICCKSPALMKGYYKRKSDVFDADGFLKTGDIGYYDAEECLFVMERIKEMFKYQSWHIIPSAIEEVLQELPAVAESVVFGVPDEVDGEVPAACIVLRENGSLSEEEIDEFLRRKVADRERLRGGVSFVASLPKTPTGKVVRKEIKEAFARNRANKAK